MPLPTGWKYLLDDEEEEEEKRTLPEGWSYLPDESSVTFDPNPTPGFHPVAPPPPPEPPDYEQLRAGTGSVVGDIAQDAAMAFLPERFSSQIAEKLSPGSVRFADDFGNYGIERDGQQLAMNQPGLGLQDGINLAAAMSTGGAALAAKTIPKIGTAAAAWLSSHPIIASGLGAGSFGLAQQVAGSTLTEEELSGSAVARDALAGTVLPIGLKALVTPFRATLGRMKSWMTKGGDLTAQAKRALDSVGVKYAHLTPADIKILNKEVARLSRFSDQAQGRGAALSINDIRATEGMLTQYPSRINSEIENQMGLPRWSTAAQKLAREGDEIAPQSSAQAFTRSLEDRATADFKQAGQNFNVARRAGEVADVRLDINKQAKMNIREQLEIDLDKGTVKSIMKGFPKAKKAPDETVTILGPNGQPMSIDVPSEKGKIPATYRQMFEWRKGIDDPTGKARQAFDAEMTRHMDEMLAGDMGPDAIKAWNKANQQYDKITDLWRDGDVIFKMINKGKQGAELKLDPDAAWNTLFNSSKAGFLTKSGTQQAARKVKEIFGINSPEMDSFRAALGRKMLMLDDLLEPSMRADNLVSAKGFSQKQLWAKTKKEWGSFLTELYPPEVLQRMDNLVIKANWLDPKRANLAPLAPTNSFIVNGLKRIGDATFRWARSGSRQLQEMFQKGGVEATEASLGGKLMKPIPLLPGATTAEVSEIFWDELYNEILEENGYGISEYVPEWFIQNSR